MQTLFAESSERATIDAMVEGFLELSCKGMLFSWTDMERTRNWASWVAREEVVALAYTMQVCYLIRVGSLRLSIELIKSDADL